MTTFHPQQSDCGRRVRKKANASTFKFTSQIAPSICTVMFTKREKSSATIFKSQCKRTSLNYHFIQGSLTPCQNKVFTARQISPIDCAESRETVTRWPRNIRQDIRRNFSRHVRAMSRQWPGSGNGNAAERPSRRLARQLALRRIGRDVRAGNLRDNSQPRNTVSDRRLASTQISTMTFKNYEHTNHTNARS